MNRTLFSILGGFLAMFVTATAIAIGMRPFAAPMFGPFIRTDADGLAFAPLVAGYLIVTCILTWLVAHTTTSTKGWRHGAMVGFALGLAVFLGDHLVTAGWSKLPALPMLISGGLDTFAVMAGGIVIAMIRRTESQR
jgi:hypothetical protein